MFIFKFGILRNGNEVFDKCKETEDIFQKTKKNMIQNNSCNSGLIFENFTPQLRILYLRTCRSKLDPNFDNSEENGIILEGNWITMHNESKINSQENSIFFLLILTKFSTNEETEEIFAKIFVFIFLFCMKFLIIVKKLKIF